MGRASGSCHEATGFTTHPVAPQNRAKAAAHARFVAANPGGEGAFVLVGGPILFYADPDGEPPGRGECRQGPCTAYVVGRLAV